MQYYLSGIYDVWYNALSNVLSNFLPSFDKGEEGIKGLKMKKLLLGLCIVTFIIFVLSFAGCTPGQDGITASEGPEMYVEKAQMTEEEQLIAGLLGSSDSNQLIYDFKVGENTNTMEINTYVLKDGNWSMVSGGGQIFTDETGRLALSFENLAEGLRVAVQSEHNGGSNSYEAMSEEVDPTIMGMSTSILTEKTELVYDVEQPLVVQIATSKNEIRTYTVDHFFQPEVYEAENYEQVYAITLRFSEKTLNELALEQRETTTTK